MAPVYMALRESDHFQPVLISTGQHAQMLNQACSAFGLVPDIDLRLMQPNQALGELTGRVVQAMNEIFKSLFLKAILVQGDTTTVLGSALAAFYNKVPIGHVEAGLRTYDMSSPCASSGVVNVISTETLNLTRLSRIWTHPKRN